MTATLTIPDLRSNGAGRWWVACRRCCAGNPCPSWPAPDLLRLLADAKRLGWTVVAHADGRHVLSCPRCVVRRHHQPL
jgi:hypothetical protein